MIVVGTNVIAYLLIPDPQTEDARRVLRSDPEWIAPSLWRSELRNLLLGYLRRGTMTLAEAILVMAAAEKRLADGDVRTETPQVLGLAAASGCTAYDCEFVAVAQTAGVPLVTLGGKLLSSFTSIAISPAAFAPP